MSSGCSRLLVANRGEIARRVFATAQEMGIETVAVYADGDAAAPFVADADIAVALGGTTAAESYLDQAKILDAAARSGADAIHPGYGFLSENATFAAAVIEAGLTWIGPPPSAIAAMGDKLEAKKLMEAAGVPTLPSVEIADGLDLAASAAEIGYPVLVKASAGGGGKGMRVVAAEHELIDAVDGARREAKASFGDDTVFLEKYLSSPRHVEIQVLGDQHGNLVHVFERECSIQRRHQKIIEEAPSPALDDRLRNAMGDAALAAVTAIGYYSTGTVEFLVDGVDDDVGFFFLEVNTRLQVEHPVTEEIADLDLVRQQILVAQGERLAFDQADLAMDGHAVEARLYAEDASAGFLPAIGTLAGFAMADEPLVRLDSGVEVGSYVGVDFDPMLAKVIAHGPTRREAVLKLALALERMTIAGVVTNRDFLVAALRHPEFLAGNTTTDFIARTGITMAPSDGSGDSEGSDGSGGRRSLLCALVLHRQAVNRDRVGPLSFLRSGYRNSVMPPEQLLLTVGGRDIEVGYRSHRDGSFEIVIDGGPTSVARLVGRGVDSVDAVVDGLRSTFRVLDTHGSWHVQGPTGRLDAIERSPFPDTDPGAVAGGQLAPMPGTIRVISVAVGDVVSPGQNLIVMEAMKMEHTVTAPEAATVAEIRCVEGDQVDNGSVLVVLEPLA